MVRGSADPQHSGSKRLPRAREPYSRGLSENLLTKEESGHGKLRGAFAGGFVPC